MNQTKLVFVSHSGRQYVHHLLFGLQQSGIAYKFFTSFWYIPEHFTVKILGVLPTKIKDKIISLYKKRSFDALLTDNIVIFPWFEFLREFAEKIFPYHIAEYFLYFRDRVHDRWASTKLNKHYKIVLGYEECSLHTFRKAKSLGITIVLDLAQIHFQEIEHISKQFPAFGDIYKNVKLRTKINRIKAEELSLADYIICLSEFAKNSLIKYGIEESRIIVTNLGFDPNKFSIKTQYSTSQNEPLKLVYAGTITKRKGIDMLLKLLDEYSDRIKLTVIGNVTDANDIFLKYNKRVKWYSYLTQAQMAEVFHESDVFVFPSYLDSWAMVVVEAMATGLPVIVSDNTGAKDAVAKGGGIIVKTGDYLQLKQSIDYIMQDKSLIKELGKAAKETSSHYTWQRYYAQIGQIFNTVI